MKIEVLDESRMNRIFEPLEGSERNRSIFAWLGAVIFTDAQGCHAIVLHLEYWLLKAKKKVWN